MKRLDEALQILEKEGFFEVAAFRGGAFLKHYHGLDRWVYDVDFVLLEQNLEFDWLPYLEKIAKQWNSEIKRCEHTPHGDAYNVEEMSFHLIKKPFLGAENEVLPSGVRVITIEQQMTEKILAILRVESPRGRDLFDLDFLISKGVRPLPDYLEKYNWANAKPLLIEKLETLDWNRVLASALFFLYPNRTLDHWNKEYFTSRLNLI